MKVGRLRYNIAARGVCALGALATLWANADEAPSEDAISREFSVNTGDPNAPIPPVDAISREFSVNIGDPGALVPVADIVSREFSVYVPRPAFVIDSLHAPEHAGVGESITISWSVRNTGAHSATFPWQDCLYLSSDATPGDDLALNCQSFAGPVAPGEVYSGTLSVVVPEIVEGDYWIVLHVDEGQELPGEDLSGKIALQGPITIASPNLVPTALSAPAVASPLQEIEVGWSILNDASTVAATSWRDGVYLSPDAAAGNDIFLKSFERPGALEPGASYAQSQRVTLPDVADGSYWIVVKADSGGDVHETNEGDNSRTYGPITLSRPDLRAAIDSTEPASPRSEGPISIEWRVENPSASPTGHAWRDCIYISSDADIGNDTLIACVDRTSNLAGGESYSAKTTATLPALAEGQYWFVVHADGQHHVPESYEDNNAVITGPFHIRLVLPPLIEPIADDAVVYGAPYTGPTPVLTQGTEPVAWSLVNGPAGMTIDETTGVVFWAVAEEAYDPHLITIRATNEAGSAVASWSLGVPLTYTATVSTTVDRAPAGTPIPLVGTATMIGSGEPARNKPVTIRLWVQDTRRVLEATSGDDGTFSAIFSPLPREGGRYSVSADHPRFFNDKVDDEFSILSMGLRPERLTRRLTPGVETTETLKLTNHGDEPLNGITYDVQGAPAGLAVTLAELPATLGPRAEIPLTLSLLGSSGANRRNEVAIRVRSAEGAVASLTLSIEVVPITPEVTATPGTLKAGMLRGEQRLVETTLTNIGGVESGALEVLLPDAGWLTLATPRLLPSLAPGESAGVTLSLTPDATLDLGPYHGYYRVKGAQTNLTVPFTFTAISDAQGDLKITVVDEFTYFAEGAPKVEGAEITLSDPYTGDPVPYLDPETGEPVAPVTGPDGSFTFHNLPEAHYEVAIKAPGHEFHRGTYLVPAGGVEEVEIFLSRQLVSYTWNVVPTEIEDRYDVSVDVTFETNVPAPVITVDPPYLDLKDMTEPVAQIDMTITNHGLIAAEQMTLQFDADSRFVIVPLVEDIGLLSAKSSLVVPVIVYDSSLLAMDLPPSLAANTGKRDVFAHDSRAGEAALKNNSLACPIRGRLRWFVQCGPYGINYGTPIRVGVPDRNCGTINGGSDIDRTGFIARGTRESVGTGAMCDDDCRNRGIYCIRGSIDPGEISLNGTPYTHPVAVKVGEVAEFTIDGGSVTDAERISDCQSTTIPGGAPEYEWKITYPDENGYPLVKFGSGTTASHTPEFPGVLICEFTAKTDRDCAPESVSVTAEAEVFGCYDVAVIFFRGGPRISIGAYDGNFSAHFFELAKYIREIDPEKIVTRVIDPGSHLQEQVDPAREFIESLAPKLPMTLEECLPPKVILVGHSLGGDTVRLSGDIDADLRISLDPITRVDALHPLMSGFQALWYQRDLAFGGASNTINLLAQDDFSPSGRELCRHVEVFSIGLDCLRGYIISNAIEQFVLPGTDHRNIIFDPTFKFLLEDEVRNRLTSD